MLPLLSSPLADVVFPLCFGRCVTGLRLVWRRPGALGPRVANALLSVWAPTPVTRCSLRLATTAGRPVGGDPISPTACCACPAIPRVASTSPRVRRDSATLDCFRLFEYSALRYSPRLEETPQGHEQLPRHRDHPETSQPLAPAPTARSQPATPGTRWLGTHPTPRPLHAPPAPRPVACLGAALFSGTRAAVSRCGCSAREAASLATVLALALAKTFPHQ
jgi:hypothetical protein